MGELLSLLGASEMIFSARNMSADIAGDTDDRHLKVAVALKR